MHTYPVTCMAPLFGQNFAMLSVQWRHQSVQATPACVCVCDAIRQLFPHQHVVFMTRTPVFRNQAILVPFGYHHKPAGAFMRQKCAVSNVLCQESSAFQRIISAFSSDRSHTLDQKDGGTPFSCESFKIIEQKD